jgi:hypothetical protein
MRETSGQSVRPGRWRQRQVAASPPGTEYAGCLILPAGPTGPLPPLPRHGWLRRNALSPHRVRLSGAPGAPLWTGCSSANRALAGKLLWDGIVAVPEVFETGWFALFLDGERGQPSASARTWGRGRAVQPPGCSPTHLPGLRTHSDARRNAKRCRNCEYSVAVRAARINSGPKRGPLYRVDGPSGFTQAAENHGRTISERHIRTPRRVHRV